MHSPTHALSRAATTFISSAAVKHRVAHPVKCRKSSHSRIVARQRYRNHTKASTRPVLASTAPKAISPAELNEVSASFKGFNTVRPQHHTQLISLQFSNKALVAMLSDSKQDAQRINTELSQVANALVAAGEQEVTQYVLVLQARHARD